jgi:glycosyltransferase involved in cell wall biosynthesis
MRPRRVVIAGHELKFLAELPDHIRASGAELRIDEWAKRDGPPTEASPELVEWADTIFCEWCLGAAVWYSENSRPDQRVVVRFHRVEIDTDYPRRLDLDRVACVVFVAEGMLHQAAERFGWPSDRLRVIPNSIDVDRFSLPKLPGSERNLGMVGFTPRRKRLDRALEILERLRVRDPRFRLLIKGHQPTDLPWLWRREDERRWFEERRRRIDSAPLLGGAVTFEPFGPNVPSFLQKVGFVVSTSEHESHHLGLAEGMASGAIPVTLAWPGAAELYPAESVHATTWDAARSILRVVEDGGLDLARARGVDFVRQWAPERVMPKWTEALQLPSGALAPARPAPVRD